MDQFITAATAARFVAFPAVSGYILTPSQVNDAFPRLVDEISASRC
jgi:hypothetical protein